MFNDFSKQSNFSLLSPVYKEADTIIRKTAGSLSRQRKEAVRYLLQTYSDTWHPSIAIFHFFRLLILHSRRLECGHRSYLSGNVPQFLTTGPVCRRKPGPAVLFSPGRAAAGMPADSAPSCHQRRWQRRSSKAPPGQFPRKQRRGGQQRLVGIAGQEMK